MIPDEQLQRLPAELGDVVRTARKLADATAPHVIPIGDGPTIRFLREAHRQNVAAAEQRWGHRLNGKDRPGGGQPTALSA